MQNTSEYSDKSTLPLEKFSLFQHIPALIQKEKRPAIGTLSAYFTTNF
jgi:hypothetical protein